MNIYDADNDEQSLQRYKRITQSITDYLYTVYVKKGVPYKTVHEPVCNKLTGYTTVEFQTNEYLWIQMIHEDDREKIKEQINTVLTGIMPEEIEHRIIRKDGKIRWMKSTLIPFFDGSGKLAGYDGIVDDITDRKDAQIKLQEYSESLENKIEERTKELENYMNIITHDLRSPIVNINGFSKELESECKKLVDYVMETNISDTVKNKIFSHINDNKDSMHFIRSSCIKIEQLLRGLAQVAKIGKMKLNIRNIDTNKMLQDVIDGMQYKIKEIQANIIKEQLPPCDGDETQINQVFSNLIDNALKYRNPYKECQIKIWGKKEGDISTYCIEDNGIGIPKPHLSKVFDIFHRVNALEEVEGEGLGLASLKRIVDNHQGKIWVESEINKGSKFFVTLNNSINQKPEL